MSMP